jgi:hypothetical protein
VALRRDHVAGGAIVAAGAAILAVSADLPFGTLASPGAGMMPTLVIGLMMAFGLLLVASAGGSPSLADVSWSDLPHAARVVAAAFVSVALYERLGFVVTVAALLFTLTYLIERRPLLHSALFSVGATVLAYVLFNTLLKSPLPRGTFWS